MDTPYEGEKNYVLLVGDSFTHSWAPFEDKWGTHLEQHLGRRVLKCGVTGYGTKQEMLKSEKVIANVKVFPKLVVVGYYVNDLEDDYAFPQKTVVDGGLFDVRSLSDPATGEIRQRTDVAAMKKQMESMKSFAYQARAWLQANSILYSVWTRIERKYSRAMSFDLAYLSVNRAPYLRKAWDDHLQNLRDLNLLAKKNGAKLLVVLIPLRDLVYRFLLVPGNFGNGMVAEQPTEILGKFFEREKIDYLDLLPLMSKYANQEPRAELDNEKDLYWKRDGHWNIKGNHLAALLVADYIVKQKLIADLGDAERRRLTIENQLRSFPVK